MPRQRIKVSRLISSIYIGCHDDVPWAIGNEDQISNNTVKYLPYVENLVKIGPMYPDTICLKDLNTETIGCTSFTFIDSGVTGPKFTEFIHNIHRR